MEELISQGYNIKKVDIDTDNILPVQYLIRSVPTTILLVDGKEVERKIGVQSKEYYINLLR
jgi:thioredoxin-like negative regulator of GroEL